MDWTSLQTNIYNAIAADGVAATIVYSTLGTYTSTTDSYEQHNVEYPTYALIGQVKSWDNGVQVWSQEKVLTIPAKDLPRLDRVGNEAKFYITIATRIFTPGQVLVVEPAGVALMFKIRAADR